MQKEILELVNLIKNKNIEKAYLRARDLYPLNKSNREITKIFAFLLIQTNRFSMAITVLENYYQKKPAEKDFDYFTNMGISHYSNEDFKEALVMFDQAKLINPLSPLCYKTPAEIQLKLRNFNVALDLINEAIEKINELQVFDSLQFNDAIRIKTDINVALNKDEDNAYMLKAFIDKNFDPNIFYLLSIVDIKLIDDVLLNKARSFLDFNEKNFKTKLDRFWNIHPIYFALANYYSKHDKQKSENYFHLAKKEIMNSVRYDSHSYQKNLISIIESYKNNSSKQLTETNNKVGSNNIFILGSPRSGTTLIESIIGAGSQAISAGEMLSADRLIKNFTRPNGDGNFEDFVLDFRKTYLGRLDFIRGSFEYVIDKLPENYTNIGFLLKILPGAKLIRTFRNPWDVAVSLYRQRYVTNIPYSVSFFNIGVFMANFEAVNLFWNKHIKNFDHLLDVHYEELVAEPDRVQTKIYGFLNIDNSDYSEEARRSFFSSTASIRQIGQAVHQKSIEKKDFLEHKKEFYDAIMMQREYWITKGISYENKDFFGYKLD